MQLFGAPHDEFTPERPRRGPDTNPDAVVALDRIVHALERLRYARGDGSEAGTWRAEMQTCVEALTAAPPSAPAAPPPGGRARSSTARARTPPARRDPAEPAIAGRVVDHVG